MVSLDDFIEDSFVEQSVSDYYNYPPLKNITKWKEGTMEDSSRFETDCFDHNLDLDPEN